MPDAYDPCRSLGRDSRGHSLAVGMVPDRPQVPNGPGRRLLLAPAASALAVNLESPDGKEKVYGSIP